MKRKDAIKMLESLERDEQGFYPRLSQVIALLQKSGRWQETYPESQSQSHDFTFRVELDDGVLEISRRGVLVIILTPGQRREGI